MENGHDYILLKRLDPGRNMARFYALSVEPTLLGGYAVQRTWGRIGTRGRSRLELFEEAASAVACKQMLTARKIRRGYCPS